MKRLVGGLIAMMFAASVAYAYQVTGPVLEVDDKSITVEKGKEKWKIKRDKDTKVTGGDLKKGSRVTIEYEMTASSIEVKDAKSKDTKGKDKDAKKEKEKDKK
jgi:hypothetical protein